MCRSQARREKEKAMHERFEKRIDEGLASLTRRLEKAEKEPNRSQVERKIGRLLERNSRAAGLFRIRVKQIEREHGPGLKVAWTKDDTWRHCLRAATCCGRI